MASIVYSKVFQHNSNDQGVNTTSPNSTTANFTLKRPQPYKAVITSKVQITPKAVEITLKLLSPQQINFESGQFVNLRCPNGKYRAYSIASNSANNSEIQLIIENGHNGLAANYVRELAIGDEVNLIGPSGKFVLHTPLSSHLVFFATGTGIAPFYSMFYKLNSESYQGKVEVFYGVRKKEQIILENTLKNFQSSFNNFAYRIFISQDDDTAPYDKGRITDVLKSSLDINAQYYICGNPAMVEQVKETLLLKKIPAHNIFTEGFTHSTAHS